MNNERQIYAMIAIACILLIAMILYVYIFKTNKDTRNKSYIYLSVFCMIMCVGISILQLFQGKEDSIVSIFIKLRWMTFLICVYSFYLYEIAILNSKQNEKFKSVILTNKRSIIFTIIYLLLIIGTLFINPGNVNEYNYYVNGPLSTYSTVVSVICLTAIIIELMINNKLASGKMKTFIMFGVLFAASCSLLQRLVIGADIISLAATTLLYFFYFYIENPDIKVYSKLEKDVSKLIKEDQSKIDLSKRITFLLDQYIEGISSNNEIYNSSTLLLNNIKNIIEVDNLSRTTTNIGYNLYNLLNKLYLYGQEKLEDSSVSLKIDFDRNLPQHLYGDYTKIYKALTCLIDYSIEKTECGKILIEVNGTKTNGNVTLNIKLFDTSDGYDEKDLKKIITSIDENDFDSNMEYCLAKNLIEEIGGTINVDSYYGVGNTINIVYEQRIVQDVPLGNLELSKYTKGYMNYNGKNIAYIDESNDNYKLFNRIFKLYNVNLEYLKNGLKLANKIKTETKYDMIIINTNVNYLGVDKIVTMLKKLDNYNNCPIVVVNDIDANNNIYIIKGFSDIINIPVNKFEIDLLLNKYFNK